ncbi:MAG: CHAT domain-containing protein, partial [Tolypothrix sp. Co-bin9]|nr:CHAT domain-containing protein [Tolypothrix sp. Co-bin9]
MNIDTPTKKILILAANPKQTSRLRLDEEVRDIKEGLRLSQQRDKFILQQEWAVRPRDVRRAVLDFRPNIIHFSGHGSGTTGLSFEDETGKEKLVTAEALAGLFGQFAKQVECVVLNACYSEEQAVAIAQHIDYVIGMNAAIGDKAALEFAVGFYDGLTAYNPLYDTLSAIEFAFNIACNAIQFAGVSGDSIPIMKKKPHQAEVDEQAVLRWSESGKMPGYKEYTVWVQPANVNLRNFIVETKFYNPYDGAVNKWTYGFSFRENTSSDLNDSQRQGFTLCIQSDSKTWAFDTTGTNLTGNVPNLNVSDHGSNKLRLTVKGKTVKLFVNDVYLETFDVSTLMKNGTVFLIVKDGINGKSVKYE